jgi:triosephosphate isomerase
MRQMIAGNWKMNGTLAGIAPDPAGSFKQMSRAATT